MTNARLVFLTAALVGCGDDSSSGPSDELRVDGLLLVDNGDHRLLIDPTTGAISAPITGAFSITPDLSGVVHYDGNGNLVVADIGLDGTGTPTLTTRYMRAAPGGTGINVSFMQAPAFNAQGDRVSDLWWNPVTGETGASLSVAPDGRHHTGGFSFEGGVYDDTTLLMPTRFDGPDQGFTSDGQWLVGGDRTFDPLVFSLIHVPSRSMLLHTPDGLSRNGWALPRDPVSGAVIPYVGSDATGRLVFAGSGRIGTLISSSGTVVLTGSPPPITRVDPIALIADAPDALEETPTTVLETIPLPSEAAGYQWGLVAISPDAQRAILQRRPYKIVRDGETGTMSYVVLGVDIVTVPFGGTGAADELWSSAGTTLRTAGCDPASVFAADAFRHRLSSSVQFASERSFTCAAEGTEGGLAFAGGTGRDARPGAFVALDGRSLLGAAATPAAATYGDARVTDGLCQGPIDGGIDGCIVPKTLWWTRKVMAQVGVNLVPRATQGPVIASLSHRAATPGTVVRVLGYGFGTEGTLRLGDAEVPSSAITSWSDNAIAFAMPDGALEVARVSIVVGGTESSSRSHWLGRTRAWQGTPVLAFSPIPVVIGANRFSFPGAAGYTAELLGFSQIFPAETLAPIAAGGGPDDLDVQFPGPDREYRFIAFTKGNIKIVRPAVIQ